MSDAGPSSERTPGLPSRQWPNFSDAELEVLVDQVILLFHNDDRPIMAMNVLKKWVEITAKINKISTFDHRMQEVQKRWADYKGRLKAKMVRAHKHAQGTGGGPPLDTYLTPLEERASAAIALVEIVVVGDIDTGSSPSRTGEHSPLDCEHQAAPEVQEQVEHDVEEPQTDPAELARVQALSLASQRFEDTLYHRTLTLHK
ncbi:nuclear apoptosis-inducing factor 1-like [Mixophyes fleayi]|uniref:nuclear apoptosis-inducing factor 1-like n=1 Tax=Mixophyes fleayi TaxID=3061075 RepID=UPI003F4E1CDB